MIENDNKFPDYVTFPRTFEKYKWYKPLITLVLVVILYIIFEFILTLVFQAVYGTNVFRDIARGGDMKL
ncbi:hypothetical protein [Methanobrevibacter sp.]|uniref:hypothetical protein n=1 Tax=Methanobrevibacter sp. TaxID=66852 RepID=UPI00388E41FD